MLTLNHIRSEIGDDCRKVLSLIWSAYLEGGEWPTSRRIHSELGKEKVASALAKTNGSVVSETFSNGTKRYQLNRVGPLLTEKGLEHQSLLVRYLEYLRELFRKAPEKRSVSDREVITTLGLSAEESSVLPLLITTCQLFSHSASSGSEGWNVGILEDSEDFPDGSLDSTLETLVLRSYRIDALISYDAQIAALSDSRSHAAKLMETNSKPPTVFISYSHDSKDHKEWVLHLATKLRTAGIVVLLDQWHLGPGGDVPHFMEKAIDQADRVLLICTDKYVRKVDDRQGGAGYEAVVTSGELMKDLTTRKFIPVLRQQSSPPKIPRGMLARYYINLSHGSNYDEELEKLVRDLHGTPLNPEPPLGSNPYVSGSASGSPPVKPTAQASSPIAPSDELAQKIGRFREGRLEKIRRGEFPEPLDQSAVLAFHLMPVESFGSPREIDVRKLPDKVFDLMRPINTRGDGWGPLYSLDGFAKVSHTCERKVMSYSLLFRNGSIEGVDAYSFAPGPNNITILRPQIYEAELRKAIARFGEIYETLNIRGPYFASISLLGVKGLSFYPDPRFDWSGLRPIASQDVVLEQRLVPAWRGDPDEILKPFFDQIWNVCGLHGSRNYDESGRWRLTP